MVKKKAGALESTWGLVSEASSAEPLVHALEMAQGQTSGEPSALELAQAWEQVLGLKLALMTVKGSEVRSVSN